MELAECGAFNDVRLEGVSKLGVFADTGKLVHSPLSDKLTLLPN